MGRPIIDLTGQTFGRLTVIARTADQKTQPHWICRCSCDGKEIIVAGRCLRYGFTTSCRCLQKETMAALVGAQRPNWKHGRSTITSGTAYRSWQSMIQRCTNANHTGWRYYGGRGIEVCDRWRDFPIFLADMGERPKGTSIDRYPDNNGNYEPGNCRWATRAEQTKNREVRSC